MRDQNIKHQYYGTLSLWESNSNGYCVQKAFLELYQTFTLHYFTAFLRSSDFHWPVSNTTTAVPTRTDTLRPSHPQYCKYCTGIQHGT